MFKFNYIFFIVAIVIFLVELIIAIYLKDGFRRHTFGDFLVVILMYCFVRSFVKISPIKIAIFTLGFSFVVEFLQLLGLLEYLGLEHNQIAVIVLGSSFHISDLVAYTLGTLTILFIDLKFASWKP